MSHTHVSRITTVVMRHTRATHRYRSHESYTHATHHYRIHESYTRVTHHYRSHESYTRATHHYRSHESHTLASMLHLCDAPLRATHGSYTSRVSCNSNLPSVPQGLFRLPHRRRILPPHAGRNGKDAWLPAPSLT